MDLLEPVKVRLKLNELLFHFNAQTYKPIEPYLWNIFFKIDGSSITITDNFRLSGKAAFHFSTGSHGNLTTKPANEGDTFTIATPVGEWVTKLKPLILPHFGAPITGVVGVMSVLMEKNNLTMRGAEAAHRALNKYVKDAINLALLDFDPKRIDIYNIENSVKVYFSEKISKFTSGIEGKIGLAAIRSQNLLENLWTLMDKDELIGYEMWSFSHSRILDKKHETFSQRWSTRVHGDWELKGLVELVD